MKKVAIEFTYYIDIIEVPDDILLNMKKYQKSFDKWIYDKTNDHGYWEVINGKKKAVSFDTEAFVKYLNNFHLKSRKEQAKVLKHNVDIYDKDILTLYF